MTTIASTDAATTQRAGRREWIGLAVLALPTILLSLDMSVLYLALPFLSRDLGATGTEQLWIMDIYGFMIAGFLVTMGTLGDRIGRRKLLMIGATAFSVASVAAAYSSSPTMLILTRALLGIAGATLMPSTLALIRNMFHDERQRGVAISVWFTSFMGGMTIGPLVGGALLETFWWGSAFLLGVPVMVLLLATAPALLPEYRDESAGRIDLFSVVLSLASILPVIYGIKELAKHGLQSTPLTTIVVGLVVGAVFVRRQTQLSSPLVDLSLLRNRRFTAALSLNLGGGVVMAGTFLLLSMHLQMVEGLTPVRAGLSLVPINVAMAAASMAAPQLAQRVPISRIVAGGLLTSAAGMLLISLADGNLWLLLAGMLIAAVGISQPAALGINLVIGAAPAAKAGSAAALAETGGELGVALGVAVMGTIGTAIYRSQLDLPTGLSSDGVAATRESLAGAVNTADQLPGSIARPLLDSAQAAFTNGLGVAAAIGCVLMLGLAALSAALFRDKPTQSVDVDDQLDVDAATPEVCNA